MYEPAIQDLHVLSLGAAVLRIPVLYGEVEKLEESAVTVMFDKVQFSNKSANMDHWQQRFPTHVKDVASVCRQLAEKRMLVSVERGTLTSVLVKGLLLLRVWTYVDIDYHRLKVELILKIL